MLHGAYGDGSRQEAKVAKCKKTSCRGSTASNAREDGSQDTIGRDKVFFPSNIG